MTGENQGDNVRVDAVNPDSPSDRSSPRTPGRVRRLLTNLAGVGLAAAGVTVLTYLCGRLQAPATTAGDVPGTTVTSTTGRPISPKLFRDWPQQPPAVALVLSGQMHGYLQPCGCSEPQVGGLERRYNFLQTLKQRGWPVIPLDLGDLAQSASAPQTKIKYRVSMQALDKMGYAAVGVGGNEMALPLLDALAEHTVNTPTPPVLAANLENKKTRFADLVGSSTLARAGTGPLVGVVAAVGPSVGGDVRDPDVSFGANAVVLAGVITDLAPKKPDLLVLLYQGTQEEAKACAQRFPQFRLILCQTRESEPSGVPTRVGDTFIVGVGHKGKYVGVVGCFATPGQPGFDLRYQLVSLSEEYKTAPGQEAANPIGGLMEAYTQELRRDEYLSRYPKHQHPVQVSFPKAEYVGSAKCKGCHKEAYKVWEGSKHAHAYADLEHARHPSLRQFDGECVVCHVVGFDYKSGYRDQARTSHLTNVGCESCHGPGSLHAAGDKSPELLALMNPFKFAEKEGEPKAAADARRKNLLTRLDQACMKCHDTDNDVHWDFEHKWPKIEHHE